MNFRVKSGKIKCHYCIYCMSFLKFLNFTYYRFVVKNSPESIIPEKSDIAKTFSLFERLYMYIYLYILIYK